MFSMTGAYELNRAILGSGLRVELGFEAGAIEDTMFQRIHTETTMQTGTVGGRCSGITVRAG